MAQASITVDVLAKVKGWQEELTKLKAAAAKIDLGSSFGKDLTRVIKSLETQIDSMGKNMSQRLTSDSGIDSFVTKLDNVDQRFKSIGESLTTVTFDQLDPSYVTAELKDLNTQLENAKTALESANKASFNDVVGSVSSVRIALTRMGEDITKISMDEAISKLTTGIADLDTKIHQATADLQSMREQRDQLLNEQKTLNSSPLFNITDMAQKVSEIIGSQSDYAIQRVNTQRINDYIAELKSTLTAAGVELGEETSAINEAFNQLAGSKTAGEIRTNLINLRRVVKENSDLTSDAALNRVNLGGVASKIKEWMTDNEAALNEAKARLQAKIEELQISPDKAKTIVDSFVSTIKSGGWEAGKQALEQQLNDYKTTITSRRSEIETELNNLKTLISNTDTQVKRDQYTRGVAQEASTKGWDELIAKLTAENQRLADRVTNLERALQQKMDSMLSNVTGTGKNTIGSAQQGFKENAAAAKMYKTELEQVQAREQMIGKIQGVVQRWFSIYAAVRMVTNAIKSVISTVKELDATITEIAIVTKMDQSDLWGQMETYTNMARAYASSISGVYRVSQLYYQQGLQTADVMALTEQTLKMARISGLDYAEATDYMTNAVRSFKMEMTEAQTVVDVYSAIAASSATNVSELASAMSKTASSAQAVGSSFENTTAMMAVMIEATRESPENIGSAMKSIISRYGELKENITGVDAEGEEYSLNKVDTALQSVGLSIHDINGEFRDFDDVIMELAEKWDTIDKNTQRYIATVMAGNRQQSRFLALVSSYDRLSELTKTAAESQDAAQLQFLKTLDSVDAKTQQLKTSLQSLYVDTGLETAYKGVLDWLNNIVITLTNLPTIAGLPIPAIIKIGTTFASVANVVTTLFGLLKNRVAANIKALTGESVSTVESAAAQSIKATEQEASARIAAMEKYYKYRELREAGLTPLQISKLNFMHTGGTASGANGDQQNTGIGLSGKGKGVTRGWAIGGLVASMAGLLVAGIADNIDEKTQKNRNTKAALTGGSNLLQGVGLGASMGGLKGAIAGGVLGGLKGLVEALSIARETTEERVSNITQSITEANNEKIKSKDDLKTLDEYKEKYEELSQTQYESAEKKKEFIDLQNEIAASYPELISRMDEEGNYIVNMTEGYEKLATAKRNAYKNDIVTQAGAELNGLNDVAYVLKNIYGQDIQSNAKNIIGMDSDRIEELLELDYSTDQSKKVREIFADTNGVLDNWKGKNTLMRIFGQDNLARAEFLDRGENGWDITSEGTEATAAIYEAYLAQAEAGLDKISAQAIVLAQFPDEYADLITNFNTDVYNELKGRFNVQDYSAELVHNRMSGYATEYVNLIADIAEQTFKNSSNELQKRAIKEQLLTDWDTYYAENKHKIENKERNSATGEAYTYQDLVQDFYKSHEEFWYNTQLESDLLRGMTDEMNEFYLNMGTHTKDDIAKLFPGTDELSVKRRALFEKIFDQDYKEIIDGYNSWIDSIDSSKFNIKSYANKFGPQFLQHIMESYTNILDNNSLSTGQKQSQISGLNNIYDIVGSDLLTFDQRNNVLSKMASADLTSAKGIHELITSLEDVEGLDLDSTGLRSALVGFKDSLIINIATELQSYIDTFSKMTADLEKDMSNAAKGMNFRDAMALAIKLGKSITDFRFTAGKYYYDNIEDIVDYYEKQNEDYLNDLSNEIESKKTTLSNTFHIRRSAESNQIENGVLHSDEYDRTLDELFEEFGDDTESIIASIEGMDWDNIEGVTKEELLNLAQLYMKRTGDDIGLSFSEWLKEYYEQLYKETAGASAEYTKDLTARTYISNGNLDKFTETIVTAEGQEERAREIRANSVYGGSYHISWDDAIAQAIESQREAITDAVLNGNWDELPKEALPYLNELWNFVHDSTKNAFSAAINVFSGEGDQLVQVTDANRALLERLTGKSLENINEVILENIDPEILKNEIRADATLSQADRAALLKSVFEQEHPDLSSAIEGVLTEGQITYSAAESYLIATGEFTGDVEKDMERLGFAFDSLTGTWSTTNEAAEHIDNQIARFEAQGQLTSDQLKKLNKLYAQRDNATGANRHQAITSAFTNAFKDSDKLTTEMVANLATATGTKYNEFIASYLQDNGDGTYKIDPTKLLSLLNEAKGNVGEATYNTLLEEVASIEQDILSVIESAGTYSTSGTTSIADMQKFTNEFNKGLSEADQYSMDDLFEYNSDLRSFTLNPQRLYEFIQRKREELQALGLQDEEINQYIKDYTDQLTSANVDISDFLKAGDKSRDSKAWNTFRQQLKTWATSNWYGVNPAEDTLDSWINTIKNGGEEAVKLAKSIKGEELSSEEITSIYNAATNEIKTAIEQLEAKEGEIVDKHAASVLQAVGYEINELGDGKYVIEALPEGGMTDALVSAYLALYSELKSHEEATTADLNNAYAKVLSSREYDQSKPIDAIADAASMTYERLGEIISDSGILLETVMEDLDHYGIEQIGAGKVRIKDFTKFAERQGWDTNTEEYTSAFKEYNDGLIEYNRHISDEIKDEFDALSQARGGDQVNVTRMVTEFGEDQIKQALGTYGYILENGILTITNAMDAPAIAAALGRLAQEQGAMIGPEAEAIIAEVSTKAKADLDSAYTAMLSDTNAVTIEAIKNLALATGRTYESIASQLTDNENGTYKMDTANILNILAEAKGQVTQATYNSLLETLRDSQDEIVNTITTGVDYSVNGTSSFGDMQKFINSYNSIVEGENITIESAFTYNTDLDSFVLSGATLQKYVEAQKAQLEALGITGEALNSYIEDQTNKMLRDNIDISTYLSATDPNERSEAKKKMLAAIKQYKDFLEEDFGDTQALQLLTALEKGGKEAITALEDIDTQLVANLSSDDIQAIYGAEINKFRDVVSDFNNTVGEVVSGATYQLLKSLDFAGDKIEDLGNGVGVIKSTFDMVDVYINIYARMKATNEATTAELNQAYAQILTAQDQKNVDILDALQNASGMTYDALATMVTSYSDKLLEDVMDSASIQRTGFGTVRIIDWNGFMAELFGNDFIDNPQFQALSQTPEYAKAYSDWVDSMVEIQNYPQTLAQNTADQIKSVLDAKPGQSVNVAYLERAIGPDGLQSVLDKYGLEVENGILTIGAETNVASLVGDIAQVAMDAGAIIPEQMAEIVDAVQDVLSTITSLIGNGIDGNLSNADAQKLTAWANERDLSLDFTQTADGLKLTNESAIQLYQKLNEIDAIQGQITFDKLQESLIKTDDRFKSVTSQAAYMAQLEKDLAYETEKQNNIKSISENGGRVAMFDEMNGNVDLYNRPIVQNADGTYSTLLTTTLDSRNFETDVPWVMNVTPITKDGRVLDDAFLNEYIQKLIDGTDGSLEAILEADANDLGLIIELADAAGKDQDSLAEKLGVRAEKLHEVADAYESIRKGETYDDTKIKQYEKELELANEIKAARATSEDDSFNFMDNDIPAAQNNPLNYWSNWGKAYDAINESTSGGKGKTGYMGYQDFYNIITEMGNLAKLSGQAIKIGDNILSNSEEAADLITRAAGALENVDGEMKVNLGDIGIDFASGVDDMASGVDKGIHQLAQSQIDILDGLISLMEVIVAMEGLQDIDIEGDGIDIGDLLTVHYDGEGNMTGAEYTVAYDAWRNDMIAKFKDYIEKGGSTGTSEYIDLGKAMEGIKFHYDGGSKSFADILQMDPTELAAMSEDFQTAYATFLEGMVQASLSDNFDLDSIYDSIKTVLANSGIDNLTIDMGDKTFHIGGGTIAVIDWNNEEAVNAAAKALEEWEVENADYFKDLGDNATIKDKITAITEKLAKPDLDITERIELEYILGLATGEIYIKEITEGENKGKYSGNYKGHSFTAVSQEKAEEIIKKAVETEAAGFNAKIDSEGQVSGTMKVGSATITLTYDAEGKETFTTVDGQTFTNKDAAIAHCVQLGYGDSSMAGQRYGVSTGEVFEVQYDTGLGLTYALSLKTGKLTYKGREFSSKEALVDFVKNVEPLMKSQKLTVTDDGSESGLEVISNDNITITRNISTGEIIYEAYGMTFASASDVAEYVAARKMAEGQSSSGGTITADGKTLDFAYLGNRVKVTVNADGQTVYSCTIDGATIEADTEAGLKAGLAAHAAMQQPTGGTLSSEDTTSGETLFTYTSGDITIKVDSKGAVIGDSNGLTEEQKAAIKQAVETSTAATPIEATATVGTITADATGATVTVTPTPLVISEAIPEASGTVTTLKLTPTNVVVNSAPDTGDQGSQDTSSTNTITTTFKTEGKEDTLADIEAVTSAANTADAISPSVETSAPGATNAESELKNVASAANKIPASKNVTVGATTNIAETALSNIRDAITNLTNKTYEIKFKAKKEGTWPSSATGLATGTVGNAMAGGGTLMGELGPELVVQQGRYFVAGQQGAEFVDLAPDAIVFNHLQTEQLLKNGMSSERGRAVTNERVAAAYAHGNMNGGPAMASASAALAALKQLRSMWKSLLDASVKDLAGAGGGGGGGGGDKAERQAFIKELELWYNWLQKIAELEEKINYEESKRSKIQSDLIPHGQDITKSYLESLEALKEQIKTEQSLVDSQQEHFEKRRKQLNEDSPFSQLYTFDENGQLKYQKGKLEEMSAIFETDEYGRPKKTVEEQYEAIQKFGIDPKYFAFDSSGKPLEAPTTPKKTMEDIEKENKRKEGESDEDYKKRLDEAYQTANAEWDNYYVSYSQAFWDKIDADKEEMQSLHDSINEHKEAILQESQARNEILHSIEDNQISVENKVIKALEDQRQRAIDDAKEERDAIEEASNNLIDGLSTQLQKERDMYSKQQSSDELAKLQRQLGILQRSGGSAAQIASLEAQISDKMQNAYFEAQEEEINKLQEATDAQLERLDAQISIMEETLAYEKENGMLWAQVQEIMQGSPESIAAFIKENDSSMWGDSPTQITQNQRDMLTEIQQYTEFRESVKGGLDELIKKFVGDGSDEGKKDTKTEDEPKKEGTPAYANGGLITKTGYIKVHGKEGKPESILSGEDTHALQAFWEKVNADHDAMMELRDSMYEQRNRISRQQLESAVLGAIPSITYDSLASNGDQIIIEQASVNMNVEQLANDYDAERAGQQALNEILRIAKKTKGWNRIGR